MPSCPGLIGIGPPPGGAWNADGVIVFLAASNASDEDRPGVEFFRAVKSMTIRRYYTTEAGLWQDLGDAEPLAMAEFAGCKHIRKPARATPRRRRSAT
jgi:hypothetical protein